MVVTTRAASTSAATLTLTTCSSDVIQHIGTALIDPLRPKWLLALSSACHFLHHALEGSTEKQATERRKLGEMLQKCGWTFSRVLEMPCAINFESNGIDDQQATLMAHWLFSTNLMHRVTHIFLKNNRIGSEGCFGMAEAIGKMFLPNLEEVGLDDNHIGDEGVLALVSAASGLKKVHTLAVSGNGIGDAGVSSLANALGNGELPRLLWLFLGRNKFSETARASLDAKMTEVSKPGHRLHCFFGGETL